MRFLSPVLGKTTTARIMRYGVAFATVATMLFSASCASAAAASGRLITSAAIAVNPETHKVYAVDEGTNTVVVTDENSGAESRVEVGKAPIAIALLPDLNKAYVVNADSNSISILDGNQNKVIATIKGGSHPYTIAANRKTNKVYVTYTYDRILTVIDGASDTASTLETGSADAIVVDEATNTLLLSTYEDPNIRIVDAATGSVHKVNVGPHIWGVAFDAANSALYLAHTATSDITRLDEKTQAITSIPIGQIPCALALNPVTHMLYVVNYGDQTLSVIDINAGKVVSTLKVGDHPQAVAIDMTRNRAYVANVHGNSVTVIDGSKNVVIGTYEAGEHPYALAVDEGTGQTYAALYGAKASVRVAK